jgi:peptidoglycan hydrolase-like protein with peptidoglycan-binding domain
MKKYTLSAVSITLSLFSVLGAVSAETVSTSSSSTSYTSTVQCTNIIYGLVKGSSDVYKKGEVTKLQNFLFAKGFLTALPNGYFGNETKNAVKKYQISKGLSPTGTVGSWTKKSIKVDSGCVSVPSVSAPSSLGVLPSSISDTATTSTVASSSSLAVLPLAITSLTATPSTIMGSGISRISFTTKGASSCSVATAGMSVDFSSPSTGVSFYTTNLTATKTFTVTCYGTGASVSSVTKGITVSVVPTTAPSTVSTSSNGVLNNRVSNSYASTTLVSNTQASDPVLGKYDIYVDGQAVWAAATMLTRSDATTRCLINKQAFNTAKYVKCYWNWEEIYSYIQPTQSPLIPAVGFGAYRGIQNPVTGRAEALATIPTSAEGKVLVLTGHEAITWKVRNPNNVRPSKIITSGYYEQKVTGDIASTTPIEKYSFALTNTVQYAYQSDSARFEKLRYWLYLKGVDLASSQFIGTYDAQGIASVLGVSTSAMCTNLPSNLHRGAESQVVASLQSFLLEKGLLEGEATGFYGDKTVEAVKDYQASIDLPQTGMVFALTREAIRAETCQ